MADPIDLMTSPFTALGAVAGPAVLTNACSVLALGTSNRLGRVVDRTRIIVRELRALQPDDVERPGLVSQLETMEQRSVMLLSALRAFYAALGLFASAALLSAIGGGMALYTQSIAFIATAALALGAGVAAVVSLVRGCVVMIDETRIAVRGLQEEAKGRSDLRRI